MKPKFQSAQSSYGFLFGIFGCLFFVAFYFDAVLQLSQIPDPTIFWLSFSLWALLGAYVPFNSGDNDYKFRHNFLWFTLILLPVYVLSRFESALIPVAYSFPGFPVGIAIYSVIVLMMRGIDRIRYKSSSVQPVENNLKTPHPITGLQKDMRYIFALFIPTMIYTIIEMYLGVILDIHSYLNWIGLVLWMLTFASFYWIIIKYDKRTR